MTPWNGTFFVAVLIARVCAAWFVLVSVVGFLWFLGSHSGTTIAYFLATLVALTAFVSYARKALASAWVRVTLTVAATVALLSTFPQMYGDIANGPDYHAFVLRALECAIIVVMGAEVLTWPRLRWRSRL